MGVLVEAFVGRRGRYWTQVPVAFLGLAGGFVWTILLAWRDDPHHVAAEGALGVDGPTLFIQGTILVLALVSTLLIAERGRPRRRAGTSPRRRPPCPAARPSSAPPRPGSPRPRCSR